MSQPLPAQNPVKLPTKLALGFGYFTAFFCAQGVPILAIPYYQMTLGVDSFLLSLVMIGTVTFSLLPLCLLWSIKKFQPEILRAIH